MVEESREEMPSSGKRRREAAGLAEPYSGAKRRNNLRGDPRELDQPSPDDTAYRILCPESQVGNILGKAGSTVKSLRKETGAKIRVVDISPDVKERVVLIWSSRRARGGEANGNKAFGNREFVCPAQAALFKVHSRIITDEVPDHDVIARFLVPNIQIGCLLGKGGKIIEKMRLETRAQIRVVPKHERPRYVLPSDELIAVSGDIKAVQKAMHEISTRIHKSPLSDRMHGPVLPLDTLVPLPSRDPLLGSGSIGDEFLGPDLAALRGYGSYRDSDLGHAWPRASSALSPQHPRDFMTATKKQEFCVRVLCSKDKVGFIIGRRGSTVRDLEQSTGTQIKVKDSVSDSNERVVSISANEYLNDRMSPVIEATMHLQSRMGEISGDNDGIFKTSLLVPENQVGGLLGRKGSVIAELRKWTGANINVTRKGLPKCAQETDELVEITGDKNTARIGLVEVLKRLRSKAFNVEVEDAKLGGEPLASYSHSSFLDGYPLSSVSAAERYYLGSPGRKTYSLNELGSGHGLGGGSRSLASYGGMGSLQGSGSTYDAPLIYGGTYPTDSLAGGARASFTTNANLSKILYGAPVEFTIPSHAVGAVLGTGSANLSRICQISGANVKLRDPNFVTGDQTVEISGTPEQVQAAESLLQGFLYRGGMSPGVNHHGLY